MKIIKTRKEEKPQRNLAWTRWVGIAIPPSVRIQMNVQREITILLVDQDQKWKDVIEDLKMEEVHTPKSVTNDLLPFREVVKALEAYDNGWNKAVGVINERIDELLKQT